ncbi:TetR/AcrR family transcriptional regulator [Paenibacillus barengoltzii]|uniref:TetR/AcrR family transcriptional regulator n=1 Tax=Paenibacillus barengoltzii TaxID=343517 RepID=UPI002FDAD3FB
MVNPQDPRVMRTRQFIREAFRELLRSKDFDAISIKDITQQAAINRATFYAHYEDKYALLEEYTEQFFHDMVPDEVKNAQEFSSEICDQLILLTHRYIVDFYQTCRMISKSIATLVDEQIKRMLQQIIESLLTKGPAMELRQIKIVSAMTASAIYGAAHHWLTVGDKHRTDLLVQMVRPYVMNGLEVLNNSRQK